MVVGILPWPAQLSVWATHWRPTHCAWLPPSPALNKPPRPVSPLPVPLLPEPLFPFPFPPRPKWLPPEVALHEITITTASKRRRERSFMAVSSVRQDTRDAPAPTSGTFRSPRRR